MTDQKFVYPSRQDLPPLFKELRDRAVAELESGRSAAALALLRDARAEAERLGDDELLDLAFCNEAAVAVDVEDPVPYMAPLRQVLMRNLDAANCYLAASTIVRIYERQKQYKKGLFYAEIALQRAQNLQHPWWQAEAHDLMGNQLVGESRFDEAAAAYVTALDLFADAAPIFKATARGNLGYCLLMQEHTREALKLIYTSLRTFRRLGAKRLEVFSHLDLALAHLELERFRDSLRHGRKALELAEKFDEDELIKNALYLLGQAATMSGDVDQVYFTELQDRYYDGLPFVSEFLSAVDVRKVVNLRY